VQPDKTLALDAALNRGDNARTSFGGNAPLKIWEGKKRSKFSTFYDNFRIWAQISLEAMKIATKCKRRWRERSFPRWTKKNLWNSVHYEQSYRRSCWPTLSRQCAFGVCQCIWVRATWLWYRENFTPPSNFPQSDLGRRADSRWALPQISSLYLQTRCHLYTLYKLKSFFLHKFTIKSSALQSRPKVKLSNYWLATRQLSKSMITAQYGGERSPEAQMDISQQPSIKSTSSLAWG